MYLPKKQTNLIMPHPGHQYCKNLNVNIVTSQEKRINKTRKRQKINFFLLKLVVSEQIKFCIKRKIAKKTLN